MNEKKTIQGNGQPNPYLDARRHWNSEIDRAFARKHTLELLCVACLLIAFGAIGGIVYVGSKSKYTPYVIEVDKLGDAVGVGPAQIAQRADPRVIRASLASFIASARLVTPDQDLQRRAVYGVYALLKTKDPATEKMNEYLSPPETSPFKRAEKLTVDTDISTVLPITADTWQVDWSETTRDRDGALISKPVNMRATLQIYIQSPGADARMADLQRNPLGIYVRDFNWQSR
jgi:type IV secretory pathway TrbF-like protein